MVPERLAGDKVTSQNTSDIEKVKEYQNVTIMTKPDMSRNTVARKTKEENQGNTRAKIKKKCNYCKMNNH